MLYSSTTTPSIVTNSKCSQENKTTTTTLRCKLQPPESWNSKGTQNNKIKHLLLNNSSRYIQLTRLQPISNQFPTHTVATYYPHKIFVGSLSRMVSTCTNFKNILWTLDIHRWYLLDISSRTCHILPKLWSSHWSKSYSRSCWKFKRVKFLSF